MVSDIFTFSRNIEEGVILNDERTKAARIAYVDQLSSDSKDIQKHFK